MYQLEILGINGLKGYIVCVCFNNGHNSSLKAIFVSKRGPFLSYIPQHKAQDHFCPKVENINCCIPIILVGILRHNPYGA